MSINSILSKMPMSEQQILAMAHKRVVAKYGEDFFKLPIQKRESLRNEMVQKIKADRNAGIKTVTQAKQLDAVMGIDLPVDVQGDGKAFTKITEKQEAFAPQPLPSTSKPLTAPKHESFSLTVELNAKQTLAAEYAESGKCFCLTGPAGTGKTTACREIAKRLLKKGKLNQHDFKVRGGGRVMAPSIAFISYTNRATDNLRRALFKDPELEEALAVNVTTVHKLLEFEPVFYDVEDEKTGEMRTTMRFEPQRHAGNKLRITHLVIEESSMLGIDLWLKLFDALNAGVQIILVGDINQLPPVFGKAILNYGLITLPVVNLTEVYRQALESPIIENAHHCLKGEKLVDKRPLFQLVSGKDITKIPSESLVVNQLVNSLKTWHNTFEQGKDGERKYDPATDIVLSPWNKGECGTTVINAHIAQFLGKKRDVLVWEIFAGMRKLYLAEGDRVMVDKQDGIIEKISHNGRYLGKMPRPANTEMTRFGIQLANKNIQSEDLELSLTSYANLNIEDIPDEKEVKKQEASHIVTVKLDDGTERTLNSIGDFAESTFSLGYCLTVHKAQGCEWRKVFIVIHKNHAISASREMLYTAITRAREYCIIIDLCNQVPNWIANQRIKGNSVEEKIEWFNSEVSLNEPVPVIP